MGEPGTKEVLHLEDLEVSGGGRTGRKHVLSILAENKPGVLARIAGLFARRGFNIGYLEPGETVARELALFKISCQDGDTRAQVMQYADIFRGKTVDVSKRSVTVEVTGTDDKIAAFEELVRPFGLIEMVRTGEVAVARGRSAT